MAPEQRSRLRSALSRFVAPQSTVHAEQEQVRAVRMGGTPIAELPARRRATVCGTLRSVTLRPRAGVPALEAELYDGSGALSVIWLGRRQIPGIEPGRRLRVHGMVTENEGRRAVFNPRYELEPRGTCE
jgi:cytochrome c-type biogenesis protein CcmE